MARKGCQSVAALTYADLTEIEHLYVPQIAKTKLVNALIHAHTHMLSCDMFNLYFGHCHAVDADRQKWGQCMHQITIT